MNDTYRGWTLEPTPIGWTGCSPDVDFDGDSEGYYLCSGQMRDGRTLEELQREIDDCFSEAVWDHYYPSDRPEASMSLPTLEQVEAMLTAYADGERDFHGADLSWADLSWANLRGANLRGANLLGANLSEANLSWADLSEADLSEADLSWADLSWADLSEADLRGADLRRANLSEANLSWADLSEADLSEADLRGANLRGANLRGADLRGADLRGANLRGANLEQSNTIILAQSGNYLFILRRGDPHMLKAGCRWLTLDEARVHWREGNAEIWTVKTEEYGAACRRLLDFLEAEAEAVWDHYYPAEILPEDAA